MAALAALGGTLVLRLLDMAPDEYDITERVVLTSFISRPDGMAAFVAVLAGVVGMLALTEGRSGALIGVLVSVTTIPAVGNIGAAAAYRAWSEVGGAALQLTINVAGLLLAGCATLWVQARQTTRLTSADVTRVSWRADGRPRAASRAGRCTNRTWFHEVPTGL